MAERRARVEKFKPKAATYEVRIIGGERTPLRDFYHLVLQSNWGFTFSVIATTFLFANALFAEGYVIVGGVENARPGSFVDAFFFSVQTMGTIGYGAMYPKSTLAHALVVIETLVGLTMTALATGLVFSKFSRPNARIVFSKNIVVSPMNGVPTMTFRLGNQRKNRIVDATMRVSLIRTEKTHEGKLFYRTRDLTLTRERIFSLTRSWSVLHVIDETSPLWGVSPEELISSEAELNILVVGLDDTTMQSVHATHTYYAQDMKFGACLADVLTETEDGNVLLDLRRFHDIEPTLATAEFPYSHDADAPPDSAASST